MSPMDIHGGALSCSMYIDRKRWMEWKMKGSTMQWRQQHPREPSRPVLPLLPRVTRWRRLPIKAYPQRVTPVWNQNTGVYGSSDKRYNILPKPTEVCVHGCGHFLCRGQISRDYEQEFPSVEVGPRLVQRGNADSRTAVNRLVSAGCFS